MVSIDGTISSHSNDPVPIPESSFLLSDRVGLKFVPYTKPRLIYGGLPSFVMLAFNLAVIVEAFRSSTDTIDTTGAVVLITNDCTSLL